MGYLLVCQKRISVDALDRVVHVLMWYGLLCRTSLSAFYHSRRWLNTNRGLVAEIPSEVRQEVLFALALAPLWICFLAQESCLLVQAVDASMTGGAVVERRVARWLVERELAAAEGQGGCTIRMRRLAREQELGLANEIVPASESKVARKAIVIGRISGEFVRVFESRDWTVLVIEELTEKLTDEIASKIRKGGIFLILVGLFGSTWAPCHSTRKELGSHDSGGLSNEEEGRFLRRTGRLVALANQENAGVLVSTYFKSRAKSTGVWKEIEGLMPHHVYETGSKGARNRASRISLIGNLGCLRSYPTEARLGVVPSGRGHGPDKDAVKCWAHISSFNFYLLCVGGTWFCLKFSKFTNPNLIFDSRHP